MDPAFDNIFEKGNYRQRQRIKRPGPYRVPVSLPKPSFADSCALNLGPKYDQGYTGQGYGNYGSNLNTSAYSSWPPSVAGHSATYTTSALLLADTGLGQFNNYATSCQEVPSFINTSDFRCQTGYTPSQVTLQDLSPTLNPSITGMCAGHTMDNGGPDGVSSMNFSFTG